LPPSVVGDLQVWLRSNLDAFRTAIAEDHLLEAISEIVLQHANARSIRNLSDAGVVPRALAEWVRGHSYDTIHALLSRRGLRVGNDRTTVEDVVALCENGFG
jgi:hypothetical protein